MDAQIVHIDLKPFLRDHVGEDMIHECLEGQWGITEAKKHDCRFIETKGGDKCCLPLIFFSNANVIITPSHIEFGEKGGILHVVD